jgi:hypothetical protein
MGDTAGDSRWLTYTELAKARGVKRITAIRLVQRHKWQRRAGNDGMARVLVPLDQLESRGGDGDDATGNATPDAGDAAAPGTDRNVAPDNVALAAFFERAMEQLTAAKEAEIATLREAKEEEIAALRTSLDQALAQFFDAQVERDRERQRADTERQRADKSETQAADERVRSDQVRAQVDELRDRLEAAERGQREARETAEGLRQAEMARQARGLLARLRAAWRG